MVAAVERPNFPQPWLQWAAYYSLALLFFSPMPMAAPQLNGVASYEYLRQERFLAALFTEQPARRATDLFIVQQHRQMEIRCTNSFSARRHVKTWIEGAAINNTSDVLQNYADAMAAFAQLINVPLEPGDRLLIDAPILSAVTVSLNGVALGQIEQSGIFDVLLRTWIGSVPLSSTFRSNLLAAGQANAQLLARFEQISPVPERVDYAQTLAIALQTEAELTASNAETELAESSESTAGANQLNPPQTSSAQSQQPQAIALTEAEPEAVTNTSQKAAAEPDTVPETNLASASTGETPAEAEPATVTELASVNSTTELAPAETEIDQVATLSTPEEQAINEAIDAASLLQQQLYYSDLIKLVNREVRYPQRAIQRAYEGRVTLMVTIDVDGELLAVETAMSSDYGLLDRAAAKAVKDAVPFPAPPWDASEDELSFTLPIEFKLQ